MGSAEGPLILGLDQGTHASRAVVCTPSGHVVARAEVPLPARYPRPGWVEQDAGAIWDTQVQAVRRALAAWGGAMPAAVGIANQRETTVAWDARTGRPRAPAIVWQCRRSVDICEEWRSRGLEGPVRSRTGLVLDPYFSGSKIAWLLRRDPDLAADARAGRVRFGTVDSWLLWRLTGGRVHATEPANASRTLLYDIHRGRWDTELQDAMGVPSAVLAEVRPTCGDFGTADPAWWGDATPIRAMAGDQQAALWGLGCRHPGDAKCTYGTGAFVLACAGDRPPAAFPGLLTTVAWDLGPGPEYAVEGSVFMAGGALEWLAETMGFASAAACAAEAAQTPDAGGALLVPAFTGLGAPHWDPAASAALMGLSRGTSRAHIARAAIEGIAHRTQDVLDGMTAALGRPPDLLRADGGVSRSDLLMQLQADLGGVRVLRAPDVEATARGAVQLAALGAGLAADSAGVDADCFAPMADASWRTAERSRWRAAVAAVRGFGAAKA